jgi:hypothetical protein
MDRLFDAFFGAGGTPAAAAMPMPRIDVREDDREFCVSADMPGAMPSEGSPKRKQAGASRCTNPAPPNTARNVDIGAQARPAEQAAGKKDVPSTPHH